jgi:hypothetical protein
MYRRRERKALRNSNNSKTRRGRRRSKHASESKTYFTNIKNMLRPLILLFCFLHQENKINTLPEQKTRQEQREEND